MTIPKEIYAIDQWLAEEAPGLRPVVRWLAVGPQSARLLFPENTREPTLEELANLIRLLERSAPQWISAGQWLVGRSEHRSAVHAELQLDRLITAGHPWSHPIQVLPRPRAEYAELVAACRRRLARAKDPPTWIEIPGATAEGVELLRDIEAKVARAVEIEEAAQRRRDEKEKRSKRQRTPES